MPPDGEPLELFHQVWSDALQIPELGVDPLPHRLVEVKLRRSAQAGRRRLERVCKLKRAKHGEPEVGVVGPVGDRLRELGPDPFQ